MTLRAILTLSLALLAMPVWAQQANKPPAGDDPVVARVNGTEIHRSEVVIALRTLPAQAQQQPMEKLYPVLLEDLVNATLVAQAARKQKLGDDPEVKKQLAFAQDRIFEQVYLDRLLEKSVTDQKLHARYDKYVKEAPPREEVSARHILLPTEDEAKAVIAELKKGADFAKLAQEKTTDPSGKTSGGDLGYFAHDQMVPDFADAAFKLKKGEFSQTPVKTQFGWHVIKVEDRRTAKPPSFEEAKQQLSNLVAREIIVEKVKELRTGAKIETFALDGGKLAPPATAPQPAPETAPQPSPETAPQPAPATKE